MLFHQNLSKIGWVKAEILHKRWELRKRQDSSSAAILAKLKRFIFYDTPTLDVMQNFVLLHTLLWALKRPDDTPWYGFCDIFGLGSHYSSYETLILIRYEDLFLLKTFFLVVNVKSDLHPGGMIHTLQENCQRNRVKRKQKHDAPFEWCSS